MVSKCEENCESNFVEPEEEEEDLILNNAEL